MKKLLFSLIVLGTLFFGTAHAQKFSVTFAPSYGMPLASQDYVFNAPWWQGPVFNQTRTTTTRIREGVKYSLGKGLQLNGAFGYALNDNMEVELGFSYLMGGKTSGVDLDNRDPLNYAEDTYTTSSKCLSFMPGLVFKGGEGKIQPYMKLAAVLALPKVTEEVESLSGNVATPDKYVETWEFKGGMTIGLSGAAGAAYSLSDNLSLFGELAITSLSFSPKEASMTSAVFNGQDQMTGYQVRDKQVTFVDSYDAQVANQNNTEPRTSLKVHYPFSSVALKIGVKFKF